MHENRIYPKINSSISHYNLLLPTGRETQRPVEKNEWSRNTLNRITVLTLPSTFCQRIAHSTDVNGHVKTAGGVLENKVQPNTLSHAARFSNGRSLIVGIHKIKTNTAVETRCYHFVTRQNNANHTYIQGVSRGMCHTSLGYIISTYPKIPICEDGRLWT
jgi:hypothetical protein